MFVLYDENMNEIEMPKGVTPLDIYISSIEKGRTTSSFEERDGEVNLGSVFRDRKIELEILMQSADTQDYRLLRDSVYEMIHSHDAFYVVETYQKGKRYLVSVDNSFIPDRIPNNQRYAEASIECKSLNLPFGESIKTTADIQENGLRYGGGWSYGMGLLYDDESHRYTHNDTSFNIYNAGNVPVHPFQQDLKITIEDASKGYELKNETTGDVFKITDDVNGAIIMDGANITNGNSQALGKTNRKYISLARKWNSFTQNQSAKVSFDFRFYYL